MHDAQVVEVIQGSVHELGEPCVVVDLEKARQLVLQVVSGRRSLEDAREHPSADDVEAVRLPRKGMEDDELTSPPPQRQRGVLKCRPGLQIRIGVQGIVPDRRSLKKRRVASP